MRGFTLYLCILFFGKYWIIDCLAKTATGLTLAQHLSYLWIQVYLQILFKTHDNFSPPNNPEQSQHNRDKNISEYSILESRLMQKARSKTLLKRNLIGQPADERKIYDDDLVEAISEEFSDRIRVIPIIGDILRALNLSLRCRRLTFGQLLDISVRKVSSRLFNCIKRTYDSNSLSSILSPLSLINRNNDSWSWIL